MKDIRQARRYLATNSSQWRKIRAQQLACEPLCEMCLQMGGRVTEATVVDHRNGRADRPEDYRDDNYASLCASHHAQKTAACDGAFGNRKGKMRPPIGLDGYPIGWDAGGADTVSR
jgi:5-methylcytosine-specific restriction protein A